MVKFTMQSVFPAGREELWRVLKLHVDDGVIGKIHPRVLSQKLVGKEGNRWTLERRVRSSGRTFGLTMTVEMSPMDRYRWQITASGGGAEPGSFVDNRYTDNAGGTLVTTEGEMTLRGVPSFLQGWVLNRRLDLADKEDLRYLLST